MARKIIEGKNECFAILAWIVMGLKNLFSLMLKIICPAQENLSDDELNCDESCLAHPMGQILPAMLPEEPMVNKIISGSFSAPHSVSKTVVQGLHKDNSSIVMVAMEIPPPVKQDPATNGDTAKIIDDHGHHKDNSSDVMVPMEIPPPVKQDPATNGDTAKMIDEQGHHKVNSSDAVVPMELPPPVKPAPVIIGDTAKMIVAFEKNSSERMNHIKMVQHKTPEAMLYKEGEEPESRKIERLLLNKEYPEPDILEKILAHGDSDLMRTLSDPEKDRILECDELGIATQSTNFDTLNQMSTEPIPKQMLHKVISESFGAPHHIATAGTSVRKGVKSCHKSFADLKRQIQYTKQEDQETKIRFNTEFNIENSSMTRTILEAVVLISKMKGLSYGIRVLQYLSTKATSDLEAYYYVLAKYLIDSLGGLQYDVHSLRIENNKPAFRFVILALDPNILKAREDPYLIDLRILHSKGIIIGSSNKGLGTINSKQKQISEIKYQKSLQKGTGVKTRFKNDSKGNALVTMDFNTVDTCDQLAEMVYQHIISLYGNDITSNGNIFHFEFYELRGRHKTMLHMRFWMVTPEMFRNATRETATISDLYYSLIFPTNCRNPIAIPFLVGGYVHEKDITGMVNTQYLIINQGT